MIESDTIKLLRECDAGIKMAVASIDDVMDYVQGEALKKYLAQSKEEHEKIQGEVQILLAWYHDDGKEPNPVAKGMSWVKTNVKLAVEEPDKAIADLMTDGCNMGIKSLYKYLNQYQAADEKSKDLAKKLVKEEETLNAHIRQFL